MSIETVRLSQRGKEQLMRLKRTTGIKNWNVLCRWALALSLADSTVPLVKEIVTDSNVEMTWKTFGGSASDLYYAHVVHRAYVEANATDDDAVERVFLAHLHRGIGYLAGSQELRNVSDLIGLPQPEDSAQVV